MIKESQLTMNFRTRAAAFASTLLLATVAACAPSATGEVSFEDAWIKASDTEMTSMFGVLHNSTSEPVTLVEVKVAEAGLVELHTIVDDGQGNKVMTAVEGGFSVEPGGAFELEPGAEHIMLMDLHEEISPGMHVTAELIFENQETLVIEVPAKDFQGAEENYHPDHGDGH